MPDRALACQPRRCLGLSRSWLCAEGAVHTSPRKKSSPQDHAGATLAADEQVCWFGIGPAAFASAKGRSIAAKLPLGRVVAETDGPVAKIGGKPMVPISSSSRAVLLFALKALLLHSFSFQNRVLYLTRMSHKATEVW